MTRIPLLLGTNDPPPGWPIPLSTPMKNCLGPSEGILFSKFLPPQSLNNLNPLLDNHVYFLYAP